MRVEIRHLLPEPVGRADVVGVHACDVLAAHRRDAGVQRRREPLVGAPEHADAAIAGCKFLGDGRGPVGRSVIDHDQLERRERLPEDALHRLFQECFAIPDGEEHGDPGSLQQGAQYNGRKHPCYEPAAPRPGPG